MSSSFNRRRGKKSLLDIDKSHRDLAENLLPQSNFLPGLDVSCSHKDVGHVVDEVSDGEEDIGVALAVGDVAVVLEAGERPLEAVQEAGDSGDDPRRLVELARSEGAEVDLVGGADRVQEHGHASNYHNYHHHHHHY